MNINDFTMTRHATGRALDMQVDPTAIRNCLTNPRKLLPSTRYEGCTNYIRGPLMCAVEDATLRVITIMWSSDRLWKKDFKRGEYDTREHRERAKAA